MRRAQGKPVYSQTIGSACQADPILL